MILVFKDTYSKIESTVYQICMTRLSHQDIDFDISVIKGLEYIIFSDMHWIKGPHPVKQDG